MWSINLLFLDRVISEKETTLDVYDFLGRPIVNDAIQGEMIWFNCTQYS